jgi:TetR/AcrR family transcriptional regulator, transcriptional repressor for nem operon
VGRVSKAEADRHHEDLVRAASRLFRERDVGAVSLPDVMSEIGLTRGGFYKHFESKDALVAAAVDSTFSEHVERIVGMSALHDADPNLTRLEFIEFCLSPTHRDDPGSGCPSALASGVSRCEPGSGARGAFIKGMHTLMDELLGRMGNGADVGANRERILGDLSTLVGALLLSRATVGDPISDEILLAAHRRLVPTETLEQ